MANWNGKVTWHVPCPWPNERVTITHRRSIRYPRCESNKRICYGAEHVYLSGVSSPNFTLPVTIDVAILSLGYDVGNETRILEWVLEWIKQEVKQNREQKGNPRVCSATRLYFIGDPVR